MEVLGDNRFYQTVDNPEAEEELAELVICEVCQSLSPTNPCWWCKSKEGYFETGTIR
jgi:hypothetical protein